MDRTPSDPSAPLFTGVGVALVTLFDDGGAVDLAATARLAAELVDRGMRAVVVAGSTGEAAALEPHERVALVAAVGDAVGDRVPVIAGTGAPSARQAARLTADAVGAGAAGVLALSPPGSADLAGYYAAVVGAAAGGGGGGGGAAGAAGAAGSGGGGGVPAMAYHFPAMSAPGIGVDELAGLTGVGVAGIKDSSGDAARLLQEVDAFAGWLYVGSSWLLAAAGPWGATGAILAVANVEPELAVAAFGGDAGAQRALTPANRRATGPAGVKAMLAERGWPAGTRIG